MSTSVALALGGGGAKGFAHLGVAEVLRENGYTFHAIAGTSAGSVAAALIALGYTKSELVQELDTFDRSHFFDRRTQDRKSLLGFKGFEALLYHFIGDRKFEDLDIPLAFTAVDMNSQEEIIINRGSIVQGVMASCSVPGLFPPTAYDFVELVDGGVLDPVPVSVTRWLSPNSPIIAVSLTPIRSKWKQVKPFELPAEGVMKKLLFEQFSKTNLSQSIQVSIEAFETSIRMTTELRLKLENPDLIIRPDVSGYHLLDVQAHDEIYLAGLEAARKALPSVAGVNSIQRSITRKFLPAKLHGKLLFED